jgi:3-oxoacyl-[acyl-carrier-protein] synthase-3
VKSLIKGIAIKSIVSAVPKNYVLNDSLCFEKKIIKKLIAMTGVEKRHLLSNSQSLSFFYEEIAKILCVESDISLLDIDTVIVVSQTPEYRLPTTANLLHGQLNLSREALAFDINQGCSGYVYGLHNAMSLMATNSDMNRVLLFSGEATSKIVNSKNKSTAFLFGDAATVTLLERDDTASDSYFLLRSDGSGAKNLMIKDGGIAHPFSETSFVDKEDSEGNINSDACLFMNGAEVFNFTNVEVPLLVEDILTFSNKNKDDIDVYCLHQANKFMLTYLADKIGISEKTPINIEQFGNTSSASIPLLISTMPEKCLKANALLAGFGVGYSMASAIVDLSKTQVFFKEV